MIPQSDASSLAPTGRLIDLLPSPAQRSADMQRRVDNLALAVPTTGAAMLARQVPVGRIVDAAKPYAKTAVKEVAKRGLQGAGLGAAWKVYDSILGGSK
jgi:hypothetical protein